MRLPDFTDDEQYLISYIKSPKASGQTVSYMWGYLIASGALAVTGAYYENLHLVIGGFLLVCIFRIHEEESQSKWMPAWQSIITKYEAALSNNEHAIDIDADSSADE